MHLPYQGHPEMNWHILLHFMYQKSARFEIPNYLNSLTPQNPKICDPILVTIENSTPP